MATDYSTRCSLRLFDDSHCHTISHDLEDFWLRPRYIGYDGLDFHGAFVFECTLVDRTEFGARLIESPLQYLLSDALVVWRAWVMWPGDNFVRGLLSGCMVLGLGAYHVGRSPALPFTGVTPRC